MYKIYKLVYNDQVIYVGSTTQKHLSQRKALGYPKIPKEIWKKSSIQLIEETGEKSKEDFWMDYYREMGCELYNKRVSVATKDQFDNYQKEYHIKHKEHRNKKALEYYHNNKQRLLKLKKQKYYE